MSNNTILNRVIKLHYGEIALQPTKELVQSAIHPIVRPAQ
jgi:hypothetical protein